MFIAGCTIFQKKGIIPLTFVNILDSVLDLEVKTIIGQLVPLSTDIIMHINTTVKCLPWKPKRTCVNPCSWHREIQKYFLQDADISSST